MISLLCEQQRLTQRAALPSEQLAEMVQLIDGGKISGKIAKEILPELLEKAVHPRRSWMSVASA